ncbi:D-alanyl-D-alanine carboxypeptidase/D-alanyl-D-alanine-endopeptidase [Oceanobacillus piezotolerans]|uniref:D-alanyl-D-alanine carboxypeptidase/D-alanyl-D-alanine-endopeptidase n=2 Tax=Oceanobacillus piezotolerans TaxID=2448030 RepID=A0A498DEL9_9BACI|nr:D-alanyl-D-alanine carboxypeptidase/D-alanyl-D-alanine-endopeptidase [Oceanobacillus piezotolerans]
MYVFIFVFLTSLLISALIIQINDEPSIHKTEDKTVTSIVNTEENKTLSLDERMSRILKDERLNGSLMGISIRKADTGEEIYSHQGQINLHPASNMKILTAAAALEILGEDYQFKTEILTDGKIKGTTLQGNLFIKGMGDPTLLKKDLDTFAMKLKQEGVEQIEGDVIGDDSWYDDIRLSQDLNWSDEPSHTGAQVSALTLSPNEDYDAGTIIVDVFPGNSIGEKAQIHTTPETDYVKIVNNVKMVDAKGEKDITIQRMHGTNSIVAEGTMPLDGTSERAWSSIWEPTGYVVDVFHQVLEENGIRIKGDKRVGITPDAAKMLAEKESMPLRELLIPFMKLSNNGHGEVLVKEMGRVIHGEGSWEHGISVIEKTIIQLGANPETIQIRDGSGMSHKNYIPASELTKILYEAQKRGWFPSFEASLPVAGASERMVGGTLRNRMATGTGLEQVKAKTGTLSGVLTLSGYATTKEGETLIFSILNNNYLTDQYEIAAIQDEIISVIISYP